MWCYLNILLIFYEYMIVSCDESGWLTNEGNCQNTYRIVPSMATNYSNTPWIYQYNSTSQDVTEFGRCAGINGDLYFFLTETRGHSGKDLFSNIRPDEVVVI